MIECSVSGRSSRRLADQLVDAVELQVNLPALGPGIIGANDFDRIAIAAATGFRPPDNADSAAGARRQRGRDGF